MEIKRTYDAKLAEHLVTVDGREAASAHKVNAFWSVKADGKFICLAPTEAAAVARLDQFVGMLQAA